MIKYRKHITFEMERYPEKCNECPAFTQKPYSCMNERGMEAGCELGFMCGHDMSDFSGRTRFLDCDIEKSPKVVINKSPNL